jgi:hypothetical protein
MPERGGVGPSDGNIRGIRRCDWTNVQFQGAPSATVHCDEPLALGLSKNLFQQQPSIHPR